MNQAWEANGAGEAPAANVTHRSSSNRVIVFFFITATLVAGTTLVACNDSDSGPAGERRDHAREGRSPQLSRPTTAVCEGITTGAGWRRGATSVAGFGLMVKHLAEQSTRLSNGNELVKAGAVVVGDQPVTLRVPRSFRGTVGLIYGDRGGGRGPESAATEVRFKPCQRRPRSGYVGGLIFEGAAHEITLEVVSEGSIEPLTLRL